MLKLLVLRKGFSVRAVLLPRWDCLPAVLQPQSPLAQCRDSLQPTAEAAPAAGRLVPPDVVGRPSPSAEGSGLGLLGAGLQFAVRCPAGLRELPAPGPGPAACLHLPPSPHTLQAQAREP